MALSGKEPGESVRVTGDEVAIERVTHWLRRRYQGLVELSRTGPIVEGAGLWVFGCRAVPVPNLAETPMLNSLVAVPKNGAEPFHPATDDPWGDMAAFDRDPRPRDFTAQARRLNARGCVIAAHASHQGAPAVALPWQPSHEAPGWWERMIRSYFPAAEVSVLATWEEISAAMDSSGPGARGVVWIRRELGGAEATGHLIYVTHDKNGIVYLDPQTGHLAELGTSGLRSLTLALMGPVPSTGPPLGGEKLSRW